MKPNCCLRLSVFCVLILVLTACTDREKTPETPSPSAPRVANINYSIVSTLPHDTSSFTEGFELHPDGFLESTGLNGKSKLMRVDPKTGKAIKTLEIPGQFFGEGTTMLHDTIYQLTWKEHVVFMYGAQDFKKLKEATLNGEGWGLTNNGTQLIASNGSSDISFYEPGTFRFLKSISVTENGTLIGSINELEFVDGFIYANQWMTDNIYKIDAATGEVVGKIDLSNLTAQARAANPAADVLNGIAYDPATKNLYVTGKNWPSVFEIALGK